MKKLLLPLLFITTNVVANPQPIAQAFVYECSDGYNFIASLEEDEIWLFLPKETVNLKQVPSASGTKYSKGSTVYWTKGDKATLNIGKVAHKDCKNNKAKALWETAKLNGADLRAVGNEPAWNLEISEGQKLLFITDMGKSRYEFPKSERIANPSKRTTNYESRNDKHQLKVLINGESCSDSMSGELFESKVTVTFDEKIFNGCGKALH